MNLVYQVYVGKPNPLYDFCCESVKQYCQRIGAEHQIQRKPILKIRPNNSYRSPEAVERLGYLPIYEKENAFDLLDQYDNILILDSDIYVSDRAPNIFDEIQDYEMAAVVEREMPVTDEYARKITKYSMGQYSPLSPEADWHWGEMGAEFFNMGLMLCNQRLHNRLQGLCAREFIQRPDFERFVNGQGAWKWSTDQTMLNYWVKKEQIRIRHLDWRWNALYRGIRDDCLPDAYFIHFFLSSYLTKPVQDIVKDIGC